MINDKRMKRCKQCGIKRKNVRFKKKRYWGYNYGFGGYVESISDVCNYCKAGIVNLIPAGSHK